MLVQWDSTHTHILHVQGQGRKTQESASSSSTPDGLCRRGKPLGASRDTGERLVSSKPPQARDGPAGPSSASIILLPLLAALHLPLPPSPCRPFPLPPAAYPAAGLPRAVPTLAARRPGRRGCLLRTPSPAAVPGPPRDPLLPPPRNPSQTSPPPKSPLLMPAHHPPT